MAGREADMGESDKVSCVECGFSDFEYDRSWKEYACKKCGWIVTDSPTISVLDETRLSRIKKKRPSSQISRALQEISLKMKFI